jgi:transposase
LSTWIRFSARDVKHLPGRPKTDKLDAVWLCKAAGRQMIRPGFVPPPQIRRLRDVTRYRIDLVAARTAEKNRAGKLLEDAGIRLSVVASDIFGVSGRAMMAALIAGERSPAVLAQLARTRMRTRIPALQEAFTGHFTDHHAFLPGKMLARVDGTGSGIAEPGARIEEMITPFARAAERLDEIPGIGRVAAAIIIAGIGTGMTRFPAAGHLASRAKFAPGVEESAGKKKGKGPRRARQPVPRPRPRRGRRRRSQDRHLPRRPLPPDRPPPRQQESHRRRRPLHPRHHLAPAA